MGWLLMLIVGLITYRLVKPASPPTTVGSARKTRSRTPSRPWSLKNLARRRPASRPSVSEQILQRFL